MQKCTVKVGVVIKSEIEPMPHINNSEN